MWKDWQVSTYTSGFGQGARKVCGKAGGTSWPCRAYDGFLLFYGPGNGQNCEYEPPLKTMSKLLLKSTKGNIRERV